MDDHSFGHCFDKLPRHLKHFASSKTVEDNVNLEINENDPFAAAPIHHYQMRIVEQVSRKDAAQEKSQLDGNAIQNAVVSHEILSSSSNHNNKL